MTKRNLQISEQGQNRLIVEMAGQYGNRPIDALKEYVTNAVDALSGTDNGLVSVLLKPDINSIVIQDNGPGMSPEELERLPVSIGESVKYDKIDQRGEKGVGLLAFGSLGMKMHIISRTARTDPYVYLRYEISRNKERITYELSELNESDMDNLGGPFNYGTQVLINVDEKTFRNKFKSSLVRGELQDIYHPLLCEGDIGFEIGIGDKPRDRISAKKSRGASIIDEDVSFTTRKDKDLVDHVFHVNLIFDKDTDTGRIGVYSKGVRVHDSVLGLGEDLIQGCELWKCRQLKGYIDDPNLTLTIGRDKIDSQRNSNAYHGLIEMLVNLDDLYWPSVEERLERSRNEKDRKLIHTLHKKLQRVFEYESIDPLNKPAKPESTKENIDWGIHEEKNEGPKKKRKKRSSPFGMPELATFEIGERDLRSRLEDKSGEAPYIRINEGHPDYQEIVVAKPQSTEAELYVIRAMAGPMALWESIKAIEDGATFISPEQQIEKVMRRTDDLIYKLV
ncbi:hypothetical protein CMI42_04795 [Candidatus Pacearchaeota archaeon]|nr:hypothetical protein [Candidatus Pacearchaeota archaeon]|tara:strand:- start:614 stop:2131 length:1518 start_codon:yes stop_codon:yes gene_type:complete